MTWIDCKSMETQGDCPALDQIERLEADLEKAQGHCNTPCVTRMFPKKGDRPVCLYLADGTKAVIRRDGNAAWIEVLPQDILRAQEGVV